MLGRPLRACPVLHLLLALRFRRTPRLHLPVAAWGVLIEFTGWICPLTPLEQKLRHAGGAAGYEGGFIEHYLLPLIYAGHLTCEIQLLLGAGVLGKRPILGGLHHRYYREIA